MRRDEETVDGGSRPRRAATWAARAALGAVLVVSASSAAAQERRPAVGYGVPLLVVPVQSVSPAPGGMLPGGPASPAEARSRATAELDFAVRESDGTESWVGPARITEQAAENPLLKADPVRLPVGGLERVEVGKGRVPDPLHGQLRSLAALTEARLVLVPTRLSYQTPADSVGAGSGEDGKEAAEPIPEPGRAVIHATLLDIRAGRVLWRGQVHGAAAPVGSPAAVATAVSNLVRFFSP